MNVDKLIEKYTDAPKINNENLEEGVGGNVKEKLFAVVDFFKKKYNAAKTSIVKLFGKSYLFLFGNSNRAVVYKGRKILDTCMSGYGGSSDNVMTISVMGNTKVVKSGSGTQSESVFSKMFKELNEDAIDDADREKDRWEKGFSPSSEEAPELNRDDKETARTYIDVVGFGNQMSTTKIPSAEAIINMRKEMNVVNAEELQQLISRLGYQLKFRQTENDFIPSILIFGLPGQGKTWICEAMAKALGMNFKAIEVAAYYTEVFGGMPTADEYITYVDEKGNEIVSLGSEKETASEAPKAKRGRPSKIKTEALLNAGMVIERLESGEEIIGYKFDIDNAKEKYGLIQNKLMGKKVLEESIDFKIQAYALRKKLSGEAVPQSIIETNEYKNYSILLEKEDARKVVKRTISLKQVEGVLPPSRDKAPWLLLLDEFNRGYKQMNAVMNLMLTGSIGTIYQLPLKTIVCVSGNIGGSNTDAQGDGEAVQQLTTAMLTRLNMVVKYQLTNTEVGRYQAKNTSPVKSKIDSKTGEEKDDLSKAYTSGKFTEKDAEKFYGTKEEKELVAQCRAPSAWVNYTTAYQSFKNKENYKPVETASFQGGAILPINPRYIERISSNVVIAAVQDWINDDLVGKEPKEWYEENYKLRGFPYYDPKEKDWEKVWKNAKDMISPVNFYLQRNQLHPRYLKIINAGLMDKGYEKLADLITSAEDTKRITKIGDVNKILTSHINDHDAHSGNKETLANFIEVCKTAKTAILSQIPKTLVEIGTIEHYESLLKANKTEYSKEEFPNAYAWLAGNIIIFCSNADVSDEEIFGLAIKLCHAETSDEVNKNAEKRDFFITLMKGHLAPYNKVFDTQFKNMTGLVVGNEMAFDEPENDGESAAGLFGKMGGSKKEESFLKIFAGELLSEEQSLSIDKTYAKQFKKKLSSGVKMFIEKRLEALYDSDYRSAAESKIDELKKDGNKDAFDVSMGLIGWAKKHKIIKDAPKKED